MNKEGRQSCVAIVAHTRIVGYQPMSIPSCVEKNNKTDGISLSGKDRTPEEGKHVEGQRGLSSSRLESPGDQISQSFRSVRAEIRASNRRRTEAEKPEILRLDNVMTTPVLIPAS